MSNHSPQGGAAQLVMLAILLLGLTILLTDSLGDVSSQSKREQISSATLAQAREALAGDAALQTPLTSAGYLRLPDLGFGVGGTPSEGSAAPSFSGNAKDYAVLGRLPWRSLKLEPLRDGAGECLWYVVSGNFKNTPVTDALNWDSPGQLTVLDARGNVLIANAAALLIAPGAALDGQSRTLSDSTYAQCGGNYDARNYLDAWDAADAISGVLNYFPGSSNNRVASVATGKQLLAADGDHYNDKFIALLPDDIFRILMQRADFAAQIASLMDDAYFRSVMTSGSKGTDNVNCSLLGTADNRSFCKNWKEMLLLAQLPAPAPVMLDSAPTAACTRVLLFGGRKNASQNRSSAADKSTPANYLEGDNLAAFAAPLAANSNFSGNSTFRADAPETDLLRCLP